MSSKLSLETLLDAIDALKGEVAGLASGLRSAEERIARLETAAYTPPESPSSPTEPPADSQYTPRPASSKQAIPTVDTQQNNECQPRNRQLLTEFCSEGLPCDIQRHLRPVSDGIAALTSHILRIERAISRVDLSHSSNTSETTFHSLRSEKHIASSNQEQEGMQKVSQSKKLQDRQSFIAKGLNISEAISRPVFGQISTPRRRVISLNVVDSPFGNYVDERSPFSQLARPPAGQPGVFSGRPSPPGDDAQQPVASSHSSSLSHCKNSSTLKPTFGLQQDSRQPIFGLPSGVENTSPLGKSDKAHPWNSCSWPPFLSGTSSTAPKPNVSITQPPCEFLSSKLSLLRSPTGRSKLTLSPQTDPQPTLGYFSSCPSLRSPCSAVRHRVPAIKPHGFMFGAGSRPGVASDTRECDSTV